MVQIRIVLLKVITEQLVSNKLIYNIKVRTAITAILQST